MPLSGAQGDDEIALASPDRKVPHSPRAPLPALHSPLSCGPFRWRRAPNHRRKAKRVRVFECVRLCMNDQSASADRAPSGARGSKATTQPTPSSSTGVRPFSPRAQTRKLGSIAKRLYYVFCVVTPEHRRRSQHLCLQKNPAAWSHRFLYSVEDEIQLERAGRLRRGYCACGELHVLKVRSRLRVSYSSPEAAVLPYSPLTLVVPWHGARGNVSGVSQRRAVLFRRFPSVLAVFSQVKSCPVCGGAVEGRQYITNRCGRCHQSTPLLGSEMLATCPLATCPLARALTRALGSLPLEQTLDIFCRLLPLVSCTAGL